MIGAAFSFFSALVGTVGPAMAPFFLAFGLVKGGYIATEAASSAVMHIVKLPAYVAGGAVQPSALLVGFALGPVMVAGSLLGKRLVDRLPERVFVLIIETALTVVGVVFLVGG